MCFVFSTNYYFRDEGGIGRKFKDKERGEGPKETQTSGGQLFNLRAHYFVGKTQ